MKLKLNNWTESNYRMNLLQLTPERAHEFVGYEIMFKTRGNHLVKRILDVSDTGKI